MKYLVISRDLYKYLEISENLLIYYSWTLLKSLEISRHFLKSQDTFWNLLESREITEIL